VLLRNIYLSLTPRCAALISGDQISEPVGIGVVIEGRVVGQVVRSKHPDLLPGEFAYGDYGWQLYSAVSGAELVKLEDAGLMHGQALVDSTRELLLRLAI
jgi:NADPH-dependent curcumin reductase CurA